MLSNQGQGHLLFCLYCLSSRKKQYGVESGQKASERDQLLEGF